MNPMMKLQQMGNLMKGMKNPEQAILQLLETSNNPMAKNMLEMAKNGQYDEIEKFARNVGKERGIDFDQSIATLQQFFK